VARRSHGCAATAAVRSARFKDGAVKTTKSPGALAAHGASEIDELGRHVVSEANRQQRFAQAPIRAELIGSSRCDAEGLSARGYAPVLELCRELVAAGFSPACPLEAWRDSLSPTIGTALHGFDAAKSTRQVMSQARLSRKLPMGEG
jgi:hypothetical protein